MHLTHCQHINLLKKSVTNCGALQETVALVEVVCTRTSVGEVGGTVCVCVCVCVGGGGGGCTCGCVYCKREVGTAPSFIQVQMVKPSIGQMGLAQWITVFINRK